MSERSAKRLLVLSWLWLAVVAAYSVWGLINYAGLFRRVAELQIERSGGYSEQWTAILPGMLLAAPALWFIGRRSALAKAAAEAGLAAQAMRVRRTAWIFGIVGGVAAAIGAASFLLSQRVPDGSEEAVPFDAATLGRASLPRGKILIRGEAVAGASTAVTESGRVTGYRTVYAGFRPDGAAKDAPFRLFIERYAGSGGDAPTAQYFLPEQTGYLVENGLPGLALHDLRRRGVTIASPHYLLRTSSDAKREPYYIVAGLGAFLGALFLLVALALAIRTRIEAKVAN